MTRTLADAITSYRRNLKMARDAASYRATYYEGGHVRAHAEGEYAAYDQALTLLATELASAGQEGWISVKDRLPESEKRLLMYTSKPGSVTEGIYHRSLGHRGGFGIITKRGINGDEFDHIEGVTYWMPLPAPPSPTTGDRT